MPLIILICSGALIGIPSAVNAFGLSSLPLPLRHVGIENRPMMQKITTKSSLFMTNSMDSNDSSSSPATTTTTPETINPAATPITSTSAGTNEYSFFDEAIIYIRAGSGGQGSSTYRSGVNRQNGPPEGGHGGKGGNVILQVDESLNTLAGLARYAWRPNSFGGGGGAKKRGGGGGGGEMTTARVLSFRAENGIDGKRQNKQGGNGKDVIVRVPPGTVVQEEILDEGSVEPFYVDCGTVTLRNPTLLPALGGEGGEGSIAEKLQRGVRRARTPPQGGERKRLKLTLKVVADVALVAVPNAGKSTLLSKVTRAKPKIADYPFTTVVPNLGVWVPSDSLAAYDQNDDEDDDEAGSKSLILCDVPGLIAGASEGIGLGHAFLRHVERCHVILHLLDATSKNMIEEYTMINRELMNYGTGKLATMPQVVVVNKMDVAFFDNDDESDDDDRVGKFKNKEDLEEQLQKIMPHSRLMWISALEEEGVDDLMERVAMFVKKVKSAIAAEERKQQIIEEEEEDDESIYD